MTHDRYSPSQAKGWVYCWGRQAYIDKMSQQQKETDDQADGTAAHELLSLCIKNQLDAAEYIGDRLNGRLVTREMAEAVQVALDYVFSLDGTIHSEIHVDPGPALGANQVSGTADIIVDGEDTCENIDYKHGAGVYVEHIGSEQNLLYQIGYAHRHKYRWKHYKLTIIQPRYREDIPPVRTWKISREVLLNWVEKLSEARRGCERAEAEPEKYLTPGEEQCRWCPAAGYCPALREFCLKQAIDDFGPRKPENLDQEELVYALGNIGLIQSWIKALNEYCFSLLIEGKKLPGYKLVRKTGNRMWFDDTIVDEIAKELYIPNKYFYERKPLSPAGVEKLIFEGVPKKELKELVNKYCYIPKAGYTMAQENDRRPAVNLPTATEDFENV